MTSYRKMNKQTIMQGYYRIRENYIANSKAFNISKKFPMLNM